MGFVIVSCLFVLLANVHELVECGRPATVEPSKPQCRQNETQVQRCYRTALCETCFQTEIRCYEDNELNTLKSKSFNDGFCGHNGVVLVDKRSDKVQNLLPLPCKDSSCPDNSECRKNPIDGTDYCCSLEKIDETKRTPAAAGNTDKEPDAWNALTATRSNDVTDDSSKTSVTSTVSLPEDWTTITSSGSDETVGNTNPEDAVTDALTAFDVMRNNIESEDYFDEHETKENVETSAGTDISVESTVSAVIVLDTFPTEITNSEDI